MTGRAIAGPNPDHFGRVAIDQTAVVEIQIFRYEDEWVHTRKLQMAPSSAAPKPHSRTCFEPPNRVDSRSTRRGERFSSKSRFTCDKCRSPFAVGRKSEAGANIVLVQIWKIPQDLFVRHSRGQVIQHIVNGNPQPAHAGFPALARLDRDDLGIIHPIRGMRERMPGETAIGVHRAAPNSLREKHAARSLLFCNANFFMVTFPCPPPAGVSRYVPIRS